MKNTVIAATVAAAIGLLISFLNYLISKKVLIAAPGKYSAVTVIRQLLQIGYLALVYFTGTRLQSVDATYLLVGAVLGMTLPMIFFTKKLIAVNEQSIKEKNKKEAEADG